MQPQREPFRYNTAYLFPLIFGFKETEPELADIAYINPAIDDSDIIKDLEMDPIRWPVPKFDIDRRMLKRICFHVSFRHPLYFVSFTFIQESMFQRLHLSLDLLDDQKLDEQQIIETIDIINAAYKAKSYPWNLYPLMKLSQFSCPKWATMIAPNIHFFNIRLIGEILYLDLDSISTATNYLTVYKDTCIELYKLLKRLYHRGLSYLLDMNFIAAWQLSPATQLDFNYLVKSSENLYLPNQSLTCEFLYDRQLGLPYYINIGNSPVIHHFVALIADIWIIDGIIEIKYQSLNDQEQINNIRKQIILAQGSVLHYPKDKVSSKFPSGSLSQTEYDFGIERIRYISLLYKSNGQW